MCTICTCSSDEEGGLTITTNEERSHPDSGASPHVAVGQRPRPQRRPQLWKKKKEKEEREESEESGGSPEPDRGDSRDKEYEDEDYGRLLVRN